MRKRLRDKGMALVFTFTILVMLAGFAVGMYEVSISSFQLNESVELVQKADYYAEVGIQYYMHRLNMMTVQDQLTEDMLAFLQNDSDSVNGYASPEKRYYGSEGGYFELVHVEGLNVYYEEYQFYIRVKGYAPVNLSFEASSLGGIADTAYAQTSEYGIQTIGGEKYQVSEYEAVVAAQVDGGGAYGITTKTNPNIQSNSNDIYAYPDKAIYNAPGLGSPNTFNPSSNVTVNTNTTLLSQRMDNIIAETQERIAAVEDYMDNASLTSRSESNIPSANSNMFHFAAGDYDYSGITYGDRNWSDRRRLIFSSGQVGDDDDDDPTEEVAKADRNIIFGSPNTFSKMKFREIWVKGDEWQLRFYPGVYEMREFHLRGNKNTMIFDTTTGPVFFHISHSGSGNWFRIDGDRNAMLVFKDKTYSGKDVTGTVDINDETGTGTADPTYYENYDNKVDADNSKNTNTGPDGRRILWFYNNGTYSDKEFYVDGGKNLIGATAVGDGGNGTVGPVDLSALANSNNNGNEVQGRSGGGWELTETDPAVSPVTSESLIMYGGYRDEVYIKGNNNDMVGGYFCANCGYHANEFIVNGGNNRFYGAISNEGRIYVTNGSNEFYLDTRLYPFPPKPYKGSVRVWYKRKLSG